MQSIVALFWRIATFRSGPDSVPPSSFLATAVVALQIVGTTVFYTFLDDAQFMRALTTAVVNLAATASLVWVLMWLMGHKQRYMQTLTAIVGTDVVITLLQAITLPVARAISQPLTSIILVVTVFWTIGIFGYIFHRALNLHIAVGIAIALFLVLLAVSITETALSNI